jgi:NhaP-type Na+/H+ or K+/H+ antiporter
VIGGIIGFRAFLSPTGIPLGLAVGWLGLWMMRATAAARGTAHPAPQA